MDSDPVPTEEVSPPTEEMTSTPEAPPKSKSVRSEKQIAALEAARRKAIAVRSEKAELLRKEKEVLRAQETQAKAERESRILDAYEQLQNKDESEPKPKRKPARKIIVHEASSGEETEDDTVDVLLPPKRKGPSAEELASQYLQYKMFSYQ